TSTANIAEAPLVGTGGFMVNGMQGAPLNNVAVAAFFDTGGPENPADPGDYSATIYWGDNFSSAGTIVGPDQNGLFTVTGSHAYPTQGTFTITTVIRHESAPPISVNSTANIPDPPASGPFV